MNRYKRISLVIGLIAALTLGSVSTAVAQETEGQPLLENLLTTTTTTVPTTLVAAGVVLTVVLLSDDDPEEILETYLRHNAVALQHDIYMGGGDAAQDLAELFDIRPDKLEAFTAILYEKRHELASLVEGDKIDSAVAQEFAAIIISEINKDPDLRIDRG